MPFNKLPIAARLYILANLLASTVLLGILGVQEFRVPGTVFWFLALLAIGANLMQPAALKMPRGGSITFTLSNTVVFLVVMLRKNPADAVVIAAVSALIPTVFLRPRNADGSRRPFTWYRPALSIANLVLSATAAVYAWQAVWPTPGHVRLNALFLMSLVLMTAAYFLINTVGISVAIGLSQGLAPHKFWREHFMWTFPACLCAASAAAGVAVLSHYPGAWLLLSPVYFVSYYYRLYIEKINTELRHNAELNELNSRVISTLAMTIEAKDRYTHKHVERVREYSMAIARELRVSGPELEAVRIGSMVHDIGKIAVPEMILTKPGKLTAEEHDRMKSHVLVGVKILEAVNFPFPATDAVAAHHERWDGNGYPNGLKGEEIPRVGRIVALADGFDALTSDRHYRSRMSREEALEVVQSDRGKQYDPAVVDALIRALPKVQSVIEELDKQEYDTDYLVGHRRMIPQEALEEIAHAAEAGQALSEIALRPNVSQNRQEVIEVLLEKATALLPATTAAVFILNEDAQEIQVSGSWGLYKALLQDLTMKVGEGVSGWVVAHSMSQVNIAAAGDLARRVEPGHNLELNSTLSVPLQVGGTCMGAVTLYHTGYNLYNTHHQRLLTTLAEHASSVIDTLFRLETNQVLAHTDSLTDLPNTRHLIHHLETLTAGPDEAFSVLLLDLNGFKQINDRRGHLEGDRVLRDVARILRESTRAEDFVGRYAGDEFVIVCHGRNAEEAFRIAARIRAGFRRYSLGGVDGECLSASIGAANFPIDGADWRSLLSSADRRMYEDKLNYHGLAVSDRATTLRSAEEPSISS